MAPKAVASEHSGTIVVNFDGLCEPKNPGGIATYGIIVRQGGRKILEQDGLADAAPWSEDATNNVAEYSALIHALAWLLRKKLNHEAVLVQGDSRLVINQLKGDFKVKAPRLIEHYLKAKQLTSQFDNLRFEWVDRSRNEEADLLSRRAFATFLKTHKQDR